MSNEPQDMPGPTKPEPEHEWLNQLVGDWKVETVMSMGPGTPEMTGTGSEKVEMMGPMWATGYGTATMPNGDLMHYRTALGYDVSFKQYRGCWYASASSHLWKYEGEMSADGKTLTLHCVGPNMMVDGETANYRDVIEIQDDNHRTLTSYGQDADGNWQSFMKSSYTRVS